MGTPDFGVPTLRYLAERGFSLKAVVTQPDKPSGRGYQDAYSAVKQAALELGLPVLQPENVNEPAALETLAGYQPEVMVVAAFGQILKPALLALPRLGCVNLHASLLPKYRGAAPIQWAIAQGETVTGVTVQRMAKRVDAGDILVQKSLTIGSDETAPELFARLSELGAPAVAEALELLQASAGQCGTPQDEAQATFAPRLKREDGRLDWNGSGAEIHNRVRGFNPWPGTYALIRQETVKVLKTGLAAEPAPAGAAPGTVLRIEPEAGWLVAAGRGTAVWVHEVQCAGKKAVSAQAYSCGYHFGAGDRLE